MTASEIRRLWNAAADLTHTEARMPLILAILDALIVRAEQADAAANTPARACPSCAHDSFEGSGDNAYCSAIVGTSRYECDCDHPWHGHAAAAADSELRTTDSELQ